MRAQIYAWPFTRTFTIVKFADETHAADAYARLHRRHVTNVKGMPVTIYCLRLAECA